MQGSEDALARRPGGLRHRRARRELGGAISFLCRHLGYPSPDFDFVSYAVRNLGHVRVTLRGDAAHVALRPAAVSAATLAGVFLTICEDQPRRVALTRHADDGSTQHEILGSTQAAFWRMEDLVFSEPSSTWPRFVSEEVPLRQLDAAVVCKMLTLIHVWQLIGGQWRPAHIQRFAEIGVTRTTMVATSAARSHRLVIETCGTGYSFAEEPCQQTLAVGHDLEDQPDREYGTWVAEAYRRVADEGVPRIESVNALISTPGVATRRSRYARLLLPWQASGGDCVVTSVSFLKASTLVA